MPDLRFVVPGWSENRWSDLLATLILTDPAPIAKHLISAPDDVQREVAVAARNSRSSDRLDLLFRSHGEQVAAIEVKVLSDLGLGQLARYTEAFPDASRRFVLHLRSLPVNTNGAPGWDELCWEDVLADFAESEHSWVAATARAWLDQLHRLVPAVDIDTIWNDVPDDPRGFELALRARIAWLSHHLEDTSLSLDIDQSSGGGLWVLRLWAETTIPNLRVQVEVQEGMTPYQWRADGSQRYRDRLRGPAPLVGLLLMDTDTSARFDWDLLLTVFAENVLAKDDQLRSWPWQESSANPANTTDRANWNAMREAGGPKWLGKGYGMAVARKPRYRECLFGARMQLAPTLTLGAIRDEILRLEPLVNAMATTVKVESRIVDAPIGVKQRMVG